MVRKKSLPKNAFPLTNDKQRNSFSISIVSDYLTPIKQSILSHPIHKKYKRLTATPLGRILRDVCLCFLIVFTMVRIQQSKHFQHYRRTFLGTGELQYNRYVLNVTVNNMKYRSILGELSGASIHKSSEAIVLLASGQKGADAWNETGLMSELITTGYRTIALDPPGMGTTTYGYQDPTPSLPRVMLKDIANYLKTTIEDIGVKKIVLVVADRMTSYALALMKEYPEYLSGVCFLTPQIQQDRDPLIVKIYANWLQKLNVPALAISPKTDKDAQDAERVLNNLKHINYDYVKWVGKLWVFEHPESFSDVFTDWVNGLS